MNFRLKGLKKYDFLFDFNKYHKKLYMFFEQNEKGIEFSMKIKNKKILFAIILFIIVIIISTIIFLKYIKKDNKEDYFNLEPSVSSAESEIDMSNLTNSEIDKDGLKINNSPKIKEGIMFNDLQIKDIKIEAGESISIFNAKVENTLNKDLKSYLIDLVFLDENGNEIAKVETTFPELKQGKTGYITATSTKDIATAYELKIERK